MLVEGCHLVFSFTLHVTDILSLKTDAFKGSLNRKCTLLINFIKS